MLVKKLSVLGAELSMTTNASTLVDSAHDLAVAGLDRVNISLDTLRRDRFVELTRRDELAKVLTGIDAAAVAGFDPVKINVVLMRGVNDDEIVDFATFGRERGVIVRFIEFMPLDAEEEWQRVRVVSQREVLDAISAVYPVEPVARGHQPAERFRYLDGGGEVGVIPSVTRPFCESCDRVRLTSDGRLANCLFAVEHTDLRGPLRAGAGDDELADLIASCVAGKWAGHAIGQVQFIRPRTSMSQIGG